MICPLVESKRGELAQLCQNHRVERLEIFGSAVADRFDPARSDIDFLVKFQLISPGEYARNYFGFLENLEALLGRPVDLVELPAIKNPYFLQAVEATRVLLYAA
jgi:uncharacterized protein